MKEMAALKIVEAVDATVMVLDASIVSISVDLTADELDSYKRKIAYVLRDIEELILQPVLSQYPVLAERHRSCERASCSID